MSVQSVLFNKNLFTVNQTYNWVIKHFKVEPIRIDETKNLYRCRIYDPIKNKRYAIKKITDGIEFVLEY